ncbi:DMT family transporter [Rhodococcus triatomae]
MSRELMWAGAFVALWSSGFVGAVLAEPAGSVAGVLAWRYLVTAALLIGLVLATGRRRRIGARTIAQQATLAVLAHVVFLGGVFGASAAGVDAGTVALVCALQPMLVMIGGRVGWGDRLLLRQAVGLALGVVAVGISAGFSGNGGPAIVLPVASVIGLSAAALLERRWQPPVDVVTSLSIQVVCAALVFTVFATATGSLGIALSVGTVGALAWLVGLSGLGGYLTFLACLRRLGGSATSLLLYLTPPVTMIWAWIMFAQRPTIVGWAGLALGAVGVLLAWPDTQSRRRDDVDGPGTEGVPAPSRDRRARGSVSVGEVSG